MNSPLEVTGLGRRYGGRWALRDVNLRIPRGAVVALVGPNGSGKTTLMQLAVGLIEPTRGEVRVFGTAPGRSSTALARVGFLAQDHPVYAGFTVGELLRLGRAMNPRWDLSIALTHLEELDIPTRRRAGRLSGGQQAQVALALALAKRPDLLVLDEPVASLDPLARHNFMASLLRAATAYGTTVLLSSHVVSELERVCDHVVVLGRGRLQVEGPLDWLLERHRTLLGPILSVDASPPGVVAVITRTDTSRQTRIVAQIDPTVPTHPSWQSWPVTLEDLVMAYLRDPGAGLRPTSGLALTPSGPQ